ncbi:MAG: cobalamin-binding protein [Candidatus Cloacimonetes bacterium HGW-Cloacimonetes-1]|jgi:methanogenic corrinoid protein MtbC1|nr:MAG: cobalamin-binding protein [Candidatus Cloacimonetes bacterium HGW-Cloacimonetes-1]
MDNQPYLDSFIAALLCLDKDTAKSLVDDMMKTVDPITITNQLVVPALEFVGDCWEKGTVALSQVYMSGRICESLIDEILPPGNPLRTDQPPIGIAVLLDHHVLGKRVVYSALRASGFELIDLGQGLTARELVGLVRKHQVKILLISVLMLPSALHVKEITRQLKPEGVKIVVGGAPFRLDKNLYKEVDADATGDNAGIAVEVVNRYVGEYYATI